MQQFADCTTDVELDAVMAAQEKALEQATEKLETLWTVLDAKATAPSEILESIEWGGSPKRRNSWPVGPVELEASVMAPSAREIFRATKCLHKTAEIQSRINDLSLEVEARESAILQAYATYSAFTERELVAAAGAL